MIKRSTWIMLLVLALVVAAYFVFKGKISGALTSPTATVQAYSYLIDGSDGTLLTLKIFDNNYRTTELDRNSDGTWVIAIPGRAIADQSLAEAADTQVGALKILTSLGNRVNAKDLGLDKPAYTMKLTFSTNAQHVIQVGNVTPIGTGYYVSFDGSAYYSASKDGIDALISLVTSPPYQPTATPSPTNQPAETLTPEVTSNISVTSTP